MHFAEPKRFTITIKSDSDAIRANGYLHEDESVQQVASAINESLKHSHNGKSFTWERVPKRNVVMGTVGALLALLALALPVQADNYTTIDPLGHKTVWNEGGAEPSADSTQFTFQPIDADVEIQLQGSGSQEPGEEPVFVGLNPMIFVGRTTALGLSVSRPDLANPDQLRFAPVFKHYIGVDPTDRWLKFVKFVPFSYWMSTGESGQTGFSVDMKLSAGPEIPLGGNVAFQMEVGIVTTLTHLNDDVTDTVDPMLGGTFIYRIRP